MLINGGKCVQRHIYIINPKQYDFLTASVVEGVSELGRPFTTARHSNYGHTKWTDPAWRKISKDDIILDFNGSKRTRQFLRWLGHANVFRVDGTDHMYAGMEDRDLYRGLYKREHSRALGAREEMGIWPFPFAAENRYFRSTLPEKDIFLSCMLAKKNKPFRSVVESELMAIAKDNWFVGPTGERAGKMSRGSNLPTPKYNDILSRSRISVSVMGAGYDCARFWEVPAVKALLLSQALPIRMPHPFTDGVNAVFFETADELLARVAELESGKLDCEAIAQAGYDHLKQYHSTAARAAHLRDVAESAIQSGLRANWDSIAQERWGMSLFNKTWTAR